MVDEGGAMGKAKVEQGKEDGECQGLGTCRCIRALRAGPLKGMCWMSSLALPDPLFAILPALWQER